MISGMEPPIWKVAGCDANAITKLINQGIDLTQREPFFNETVLHYWAGKLYFTKFPMMKVGYDIDCIKLKSY